MVVKSFLLLAKTLQFFRRTRAKDWNTDSEAMEIAKAANFADWDSLDIQINCQEACIPQSLRSLIEIILGRWS